MAEDLPVDPKSHEPNVVTAPAQVWACLLHVDRDQEPALGCVVNVDFCSGGRRVVCPHGRQFIVNAKQRIEVDFNVREINKPKEAEDASAE